MYVCLSFPFGLEGGMWDLIVLIPDHCLTICVVDESNTASSRLSVAVELINCVPEGNFVVRW